MLGMANSGRKLRRGLYCVSVLSYQSNQSPSKCVSLSYGPVSDIFTLSSKLFLKQSHGTLWDYLRSEVLTS